MPSKTISQLLTIQTTITEVSNSLWLITPLDLLSYSSIEKLITDTDFKKDEKRNHHNQFLQNQVFRKTYVNAKKQIDDWLRKTQQLEISVTELKKYKAIRSFTRNYLRDLKNPIEKSSTGETSKPLSDVSSLPSFEIDTT
jgi:t-SNARE complex subunit (syntaxin)